MTGIDAARFWSYVHIRGPKECWEWRGGRRPFGHGRFRVGKRVEFAHRVAYVLTKGPLKDGEEACHECDNPPCCNPDHLFPGTHHDNMHDAVRKGRLGKGMTFDLADQLRRDYAAGGCTHRSLATKYGLSYGMVGFILKGERWTRPTCVQE